MKKILFVFIALLATAGLYAQEAVESATELVVSFSAIKMFFLPYVSGQIMILLAEAKKHIASANCDWGKFFSSNILPFLITAGGAIGMYLLLAYAPFLQQYIEVLAGEELTIISAVTLGGAVQGIIKGITRKNVKVVE